MDDASSGTDGGGGLMDFFEPRGKARRSRRRHLSSRRVDTEREEMHVCGGLNEALYAEVMAALTLPRWRDWSDE